MTSDGVRPGGRPERLPIPIFTGSDAPARWDEIEAMQAQAGEEASDWLRKQLRPLVAAADLDWDASGFEPRWIGDETAGCVVALDPSHLHNQGADEFTRFRAGAQRRGETAVVMSIIGTLAPKETRSIFGDTAAVWLPDRRGNIGGKRLGAGAQVRLAEGVAGADKDLALRLIGRGAAAAWWELYLGGTQVGGPGRSQADYEEPGGRLVPLVVSELGAIVAGVWTSDDGVERRYVLPAGTPWRLVLDWLRDRGLPELVPAALRRSRDEVALGTEFQTRAEVDAQRHLDELSAEYAAARASAVQKLTEAREAANDLRYRLLFGTGSDLVRAVSEALRSAGVSVTDVDELLGATTNADLLCTRLGVRCLIEVKSSNGPAGERLYDALVSHAREWPHLGHGPINRAALVINHELKAEPDQRSPQPFTRDVFVRAQEHAVVTSIELLHAWRTGDWDQVLHDLFGETDQSPAGPRAATPCHTNDVGDGPGSTNGEDPGGLGAHDDQRRELGRIFRRRPRR